MSSELVQPSILRRGYLVIFVDGYKLRNKNLIHIFSDGDRTIMAPDRLVPPLIHPVDSMEWWEEGWAVGGNPRERLCNRSGGKALKKFFNFDDAVAFAYRRQQKYKQQQHTLVYVTSIGLRSPRMQVVRSLDDIAAVDAELEKENQEFDAAARNRTQRSSRSIHISTSCGQGSAPAKVCSFPTSSAKSKKRAKIQ